MTAGTDMPSETLLQPEPAETSDEFYIHARNSPADDRTRVLLDGDTFAIFDRFGDIQATAFSQQGLFRNDTRYLSRLDLRLCGKQLLLLSSTVREDNLLLAIDLTNPELELESGRCIPQGILHLFRSTFLSGGNCFQQIAVRNYGEGAVDVVLEISFDADYADIFEVRGQRRPRRGSTSPVQTTTSGLALSYRGLDNLIRRTVIHSTAAPVTIDGSAIIAQLHLEPQQEEVVAFTIGCESDGATAAPVTHAEGLARITQERAASPLAGIDIYTSNEQVNDWLNRSLADLSLLISPTPHGPYPYAGVPWFSTIFGRDGIVAAYEVLWLAPDVAKGVLSYLAATQATQLDAERDAQPGKILHEVRHGEMAQLREVPFGRYYGSVDSTPLFVALAGAYYERTGDLELLRQLWPHLQAALDWIDRFGDMDGDGFVEYARQAEHGLVQQGWKDSFDSISHADGQLAAAPIALCEVQAYVYAAKSWIAVAADDLGFDDIAGKLRTEAEELKKRFADAFWCDDLSSYALALDGAKRQCKVRNSNAGQCLFSGIASLPHRRGVIDSLLSPAMFSGWGVRTLGANELRHNPMSYHNGSVWPHDNALIAAGVSQARDKHLALQILSGLLDMSIFTDLHRLPELICGFPREQGMGPTLYPVACAPQAWAAGAAFLTLQSCLGLSVRSQESRVYIYHPALPEAVQSVRIRNLKVGAGFVDLVFDRNAQTVAVDIQRRSGEIEVVTLK